MLHEESKSELPDFSLFADLQHEFMQINQSTFGRKICFVKGSCVNVVTFSFWAVWRRFHFFRSLVLARQLVKVKILSQAYEWLPGQTIEAKRKQNAVFEKHQPADQRTKIEILFSTLTFLFLKPRQIQLIFLGSKAGQRIMEKAPFHEHNSRDW